MVVYTRILGDLGKYIKFILNEINNTLLRLNLNRMIILYGLFVWY